MMSEYKTNLTDDWILLFYLWNFYASYFRNVIILHTGGKISGFVFIFFRILNINREIIDFQ